MAIADEVLLMLRARNQASVPIEEVSKSLRGMELQLGATTKALQAYKLEAASMVQVTRAMIPPQNDLRYVLETTTRAILAQDAALRGLAASGGGVAASSIAGAGGSTAIRATAADSSAFLRSGSYRLGPANVGGSALGIPVPALLAGIAAYLGYKAVSQSNAYNQSIADIVSQSTQNAGSIPGLQSGVLGLAGGQNRFTPQQLVTGLYPIASSPIFKSQADQVAALRVVSQQAQGSGAGSIKALASADVGAISAYGFTPAQMQFVADTIQKGVNIGLAESPDFAKGVGTFSAASLAADPNRTRAFQQAVGAFAQQTNLSPRFRFDAQGENAFLQVINKTLTGKSAQLADTLGISGMFGPGAEGRAGGLQAWLQQFQQATGGANQQAFEQGLFGRQNALQFVRGFTGGNYASGQIAISGTANAAGTVAAGARIADAGPQAQWDQIQSRFNKDVIQVGDELSRIVSPALLTMATAALGASEKLASIAGITIKDAGSAGTWLDQHLPAGIKAQDLAMLGLPIAGPAIAGVSWLSRLTGESGPPKTSGPGPAGSHPVPHFLVPDGGFINSLSLDAARFDPLADPTQYANSRNGPQNRASFFAYRQQQAVIAAQTAASQAAALAYLAGHQDNAKLLTADRGALNYDISTGAGNAQINTALAKLRTDVGVSSMDAGGRQQFLQKFGTNPVAKIENQRLIDAAQIQYNAATTFEQSVRIHHQGLQASNAAAQQVYAASMNLIGVQTKAGALKKTDAATLQLGAQDTLNQSLLANLSPAMQEAQAALSLAQLTGTGLAGATSAEAGLLRQQAALGGMGPNALKLALYQLNQSTAAKAALPQTIPAQLIRPTTAGNGGLIEAPFGQSMAALAGGATTARNDELQALRQQVAYLQQEIVILRSIDGKMGATVTHTARTAKAVATPAHHARAIPLARVRRHR